MILFFTAAPNNAAVSPNDWQFPVGEQMKTNKFSNPERLQMITNMIRADLYGIKIHM